jgi:hypothetical protein
VVVVAEADVFGDAKEIGLTDQRIALRRKLAQDAVNIDRARLVADKHKVHRRDQMQCGMLARLDGGKVNNRASTRISGS